MRGLRWLPLVVISIALAGCGSSDKRAAPPATPQSVVAAYLALVKTGDRAQARPLLTLGFARHVLEGPHNWFGLARVTHVKTTTPRYTHDASGFVARVRTSFVVEWQLPVRPTKYSLDYCLVRKRAADAWRITGDGRC